MTKSPIEKEKLIEALKEKVQAELSEIKKAFQSSHSLATSSEMKSEGKYDTRSIEAGYIAGAQQKRVQELELELGLLDEININHLPDTVSVGSIVEIKYNDLTRVYFISSTGGGSFLSVEDHTVMVISAFSPIGAEVIGLAKNDEFEVEHKNESRQYQVINIY